MAQSCLPFPMKRSSIKLWPQNDWWLWGLCQWPLSVAFTSAMVLFLWQFSVSISGREQEKQSYFPNNDSLLFTSYVIFCFSSTNNKGHSTRWKLCGEKRKKSWAKMQGRRESRAKCNMVKIGEFPLKTLWRIVDFPFSYPFDGEMGFG